MSTCPKCGREHPEGAACLRRGRRASLALLAICAVAVAFLSRSVWSTHFAYHQQGSWTVEPLFRWGYVDLCLIALVALGAWLAWEKVVEQVNLGEVP